MKKYEMMYAALDEEGQATIDEVFEVVLTAYRHEKGAVVLMADVTGEGSASCMCIGNALLIEPLLRAGGAVADNTFPSENRVLQ